MIRILLFLIVVFVLDLGFAWLADRPGDIVVTFQGYQYQVSLMVAATIAVAAIAAAMIVWWLLKAVWTSPYTISRYFRVRRRDRGYQALSTGMVAAGAGDGVLARKMNKEAAKLIRSETEPLIQLLDAQSSLLEGDHEAARNKFEAMLDDPEMRLLGLRGLHLEAERLGDRAAARHYAGRAAEIAPHLAWAANATIEERVAAGDWDGALKLVDSQKSTRQIEREAANRRRAVLLTAKAQALFDTDANAARAAALEADKLLPGFAPGAIVAAKALLKQNDLRKASKILETAWRSDPHPDVGALYVHARPADAPGDRLARAKKLQSMRQNNAESSLLVARAALEAGDTRLARSEAESAIRMAPREAAYLLLADIEEAESGDQGRIRQYLSRAVRAPRDPAWVADGIVSDKWAPISPVTGRLDAFEWRAPVERLGTLIEQDDDLARNALLPVGIAEESDAETAVVLDAAELKVEPSAPAEEKPLEPGANPAPQPAPNAVKTNVQHEAADNEDSTPHQPDDPGVDRKGAESHEGRRFRLF
ncbi:heme biosynthesis protein HemY [Mesorhizobium sp. BAC0120]|uniref:heme biosynthesis protein HemY n=1 Tax=Mesorhizobium sp. BAC0120 TaxID=3090670 RepID=UPI00298CBD3B|nr:heme biosynthesis protein HemY [Mesorhizobium sp. BAC0120]MDW6022117.1 heme biosynthesis protein HemY [Mesorhizobium sp. BAC0120]